jgi:hypothetical protein
MRRYGDQHTLFQGLSSALVLETHVLPSVEVATLFPVPVIATAQNSISSGDQQTLAHSWVGITVPAVYHVNPSVENAPRIVPAVATAQNIPNSGDQHTDTHELSAISGEDPKVQ